MFLLAPMIFIFLPLLPPSSSSVVEKVDITQINYCNFPCLSRDRNGNIVNRQDSTVCRCFRKYTHKEELQDLIEFRTFMLDTHNKLRNNLAAGKVKHKGGSYYPKASNMRAMSYSEELEYSARCWAVQLYKYHDECRATSKFENVGQNLHFDEDSMYPWKISMWGWWREYNNYKPELVDEFQVPPGGKINDVGHFVQLAWAQTYQVGCARSYNPYNNKSFHFASLCNYGSSGLGSNIMTYPIYNTSGEPCSQCQAEYGVSCNKKYPNLCGEIDPVPVNAPVPIKVSCEGISQKLCDKINQSTKSKVDSGHNRWVEKKSFLLIVLWILWVSTEIFDCIYMFLVLF